MGKEQRDGIRTNTIGHLRPDGFNQHGLLERHQINGNLYQEPTKLRKGTWQISSAESYAEVCQRVYLQRVGSSIVQAPSRLKKSGLVGLRILNHQAERDEPIFYKHFRGGVVARRSWHVVPLWKIEGYASFHDCELDTLAATVCNYRVPN